MKTSSEALLDTCPTSVDLWAQLRDDYRAHLAQTGKSGPTRDQADRWLSLFFATAQGAGVLVPEGLTEAEYRLFEQELLWKPASNRRLYAQNTVYQALRMVRDFLRWAQRQSHLPYNPAQDVLLSRPPQPARPTLSPAEFQQVLQAPDPDTPLGMRDRSILALLAFTDLHQAELVQLDIEALHLGQARLNGRGRRPVPLDSHLVELLARYFWKGRPVLARPSSEPALLLTRRGQRMHPKIFSNLVSGYGIQAGASSYVTPRLLRQAHEEQQRTLTSSPK